MNLDATHTYASLAPTWILDIRPVWYHFQEYAAQYYGVVAMGHPILWWTSVIALLTVPVVALVDRDRDLVLPALVVALLYFPWFAATRTSFLYYMTPVAPFLAILVAAALARLAGRRPRLRADGPESAAAQACLPAEVAAPSGARSGLPPSLVWAGAAFLGTTVVTALFWWPIGRAVATVFYEWPATLGPAVGIAVATVAGATALLLLAWLFTRPFMGRAWRYLAWAFGGLIVGFAIVFAPIVLNIPLAPEEFYRRIWLPTWL
jgi:dolichyl-phosphate-mannose--protein O-mannosyl transferase